MPGEPHDALKEEMKKDLQNWGVGLIIMGVLSIVLSTFLDPVWGVVILIFGLLTLFIKSRGMYIVLGLMLIFVGVMNLLGGGGWIAFGLFQVGIGIVQLTKYSKYS